MPTERDPARAVTLVASSARAAGDSGSAGSAGLGRLAGPAASLADQAAVREGRLAPGRLYSAYQVAAELGVSRSPVREALMRLAEAGMVEFERNRGFRIVIPGPSDIAEVFQLRLLLEVPAARRAARDVSPGLAAALTAELDRLRTAVGGDAATFMRHDLQLHRLILDGAGNARLTALVANLRDTARTLGASTVGRSRGLAEIAAEHEPVVAAIVAGDRAAAGAAMAAHLTRTGLLLVAQAVSEQGGGASATELWDAARLD
jgi:DNA-binding GntR family transcriptional regulator